MKKTFIALAKKISKKFVSLLLSALATAVGELVIGGVLKGFTRIKASRKSENSEPTVDDEPETKVENEATETDEAEVENEVTETEEKKEETKTEEKKEETKTEEKKEETETEEKKEEN